MNDLSGLSWDSAPTNSRAERPPNGANYTSLRPTPPTTSRQATPLSDTQSGRNTPQPGSGGSIRPAGQDSFSNLLPSKKQAQPSLQERQKQLIEERARQQAEQQKRHNEQFKLDDTKFWEGLGGGSGRSTPATIGKTGSADTNIANTNGDEDGILAAFNASAPVDSSSHFPPPQHQHSVSRKEDSRPGSLPRGRALGTPQDNMGILLNDKTEKLEDDDDPFGLGQMAGPKASSRLPVPTSTTAVEDDDDVLGILGQPVAAISKARSSTQIPFENKVEHIPAGTEPRDQAIAELVDMGFPVERSREALEKTESGVDIQGAVGWLLTQAHQNSKSRSRTAERPDQSARDAGSPPDVLLEDRNAWKSQKIRPSRNDSQSPSTLEKEVAQRATELSNTLFKSANSLWKTGQKRMQKAMAEFQQDGESSQPRWMRDPQASRDEFEPEKRATQQRKVPQQPVVTDEAMMLDAERAPVRSKPTRKPLDADVAGPRAASQMRQPPGDDQILPSRPASRPAERLSKQAIEEQSAQAYVSPARRKKPQPQAPPPPSESEPELDIFSFSEAPLPSSRITQKPPAVLFKPHSPLRTRAAAPTRQIPPTSPSSLSQSASHRIEGTAAFKRGDYASAHESYTSAITPLPAKHPITIILFCNRALTALKTGDPRTAIVDADAALEIIGPSRGDGEMISFGQGEIDKPMKEFYGKALMRKADALEHMEKWVDAAKIWRDAVEAGVGGSVSIQGRNRCEKAAGMVPPSSTPVTGRPTAAPGRKPPPSKSKPRSAAADLVASSDKESAAVTRLRAANAAATAASDEAFALNDAVEARLNAWKSGKEGNLRALLASLDTVLWEGSGWANVGMGDLVLPNRCKVVYMKAIAKCHPDKIPSDASTEQRMISASVFATLNEAWDRFKRDNGL